jgi:NADH-quinone oxidoreductase subunit J
MYGVCSREARTKVTFYIAAAVAVLSTFMMVTRLNAVHALLYLIVSFLSVSVVFYTLGAPFIAALEVIIYAGAIMVLFVFVVMMLNLGPRATETERGWLTPGIWTGPAILSLILLAEVVYMLGNTPAPALGTAQIESKAVGMALFGPYVIGVELASLLLMGGLVGANHLGWHRARRSESQNAHDTIEPRAVLRGDAVRAGTARDTGAPEHPVHTDVR